MFRYTHVELRCKLIKKSLKNNVGPLLHYTSNPNTPNSARTPSLKMQSIFERVAHWFEDSNKDITMSIHQGNISLKISKNSEAFASEYLGIFKEMFPLTGSLSQLH